MGYVGTKSSRVKSNRKYNIEIENQMWLQSFVIKNIFVSINHLPQRWSYLQPTCIRCQIYINRTWTWTTELTTDFESYDFKSGNLRAFHCVTVHCFCFFFHLNDVGMRICGHWITFIGLKKQGLLQRTGRVKNLNFGKVSHEFFLRIIKKKSWLFLFGDYKIAKH